MAKPENHFLGKWRIVWMEAWDTDFFDMEGPAYLQIKRNNVGEFHFGTVQGVIDGRIEMVDDLPRFSFSWAGSEEMNDAGGRGWMVREGKQVNGHIYFHMGEESAFRAKHEE